MQKLRQLLLAALVGFTVCSSAAAQSDAAASLRERPVRIIVPFGPGGLADISIRLLGDKLSPLLGTQVVVENLPGAGGVAAAASLMKAKPDGHTLLVVTNGTAISTSLFKHLPYDPVKDFAPVSLVTFFDLIILTKVDSRFHNLADLLAQARANPGKFNFGTINPGSTQNLSAQLFKSVAGIDVVIIPFRTSPNAAAALMTGDIDAVFESYAAMKSLIGAGRLKPIASTGTTRFGYLPDLPTAREAGLPGYEVVGWNSIAAPAGTPAGIIAVLNRHINTVVATPEFKKRMLDFGTLAHAGTPGEMHEQLVHDIAKWAAVIKKAGIPQQ